MDRHAFSTALVLAPFLVLIGYVGLISLDGVTIDDRGLLLLAAWPALASLLVSLVVPRDRRRWLSAALGCVVGTALAVALVAGAISLLAGMMSDPAPPPAP